MEKYLAPTHYFDFNEPNVQALIASLVQPEQTPLQKAIIFYYWVRDTFYYYPYQVVLHPDALKMSYLITKKKAYCVEKSIVMVGLCRAVGIPARLCFANVRNHLGTDKIEKILGTDILVFHGFCELFLQNQWVKATPVFNKELCEKFRVPSLEFDGITDSIFQAHNEEGTRFMEYLHEHGNFDDMPFQLFKQQFQQYYGHLLGKSHGDMFITEEFVTS